MGAKAMASEARRSPRPALRRILRAMERTLAVIGLLFLIYHIGFQMTVMTSESMAPTLLGTNYESGDRILVEKVTGWVRSPCRWEIYFFYEPDGTPVMKRVAGLPGEKISIKDNRVFINGVAVPL